MSLTDDLDDYRTRMDDALFIADKFDVDAETKVRLMVSALEGKLEYSASQETGE